MKKITYVLMLVISSLSYANTVIKVDNTAIAKSAFDLSVVIANTKATETDSECTSNLFKASDEVNRSGRYILETQYLLASMRLAEARYLLSDGPTANCVQKAKIQQLKNEVIIISNKIAGLD